jgi:hypothetical protein
VSASATVLAHGLGGSTDLPIPYSYALIGASWALTISFGVVALAWKRPRFDPDNPARPLPDRLAHVIDAPVTRWMLAGLGVLVAGWVVVVSFIGPQGDENALPPTFYVLLWVGLVAVSVLTGPIWRAVSPVRTVLRLLPARGVRPYPQGWGYRPAAIGLFAFVWLELASPDPGALGAVRGWLLGYLVVMVVGAGLFGERWLARADPFEVYSVVASRLSPFRRDGAGRLVVGNPFDHLLTLPVRPGTLTVLAVLLGSTAFDGFSAMPEWQNFVDGHANGPWTATLVKTVGLLVFIVVVGATFWAAAQATGGVDRTQRRALPGQMAHSLIPIVIGYVFAHYLTYLVERGQQAVIRLLEPAGLGWDVNYVLSLHPSVLATIKVCCVVAGHIAGVIAAHDRALRLLPAGHQLTGQLAMMLVMVAYTFTGLYLLFGG